MKHRRLFITLLLIFVLLFPCACRKLPAQEPAPGSASQPPTSRHLRLEREDWADDVKTALNDLLSFYGTDSETPAETPYAVFDFDNTSSIFDVEEQFAVYQLQRMIDENMTVADILDTFAVRKEAGENGFAFNTGFVAGYAGYHTRK